MDPPRCEAIGSELAEAREQGLREDLQRLHRSGIRPLVDGDDARAFTGHLGGGKEPVLAEIERQGPQAHGLARVDPLHEGRRERERFGGRRSEEIDPGLAGTTLTCSAKKRSFKDAICTDDCP
jgi:hypothetical protein